VWPWLVRPLTWPTYYDNASNVRFLDGGGPELALRTRFRWTQRGIVPSLGRWLLRRGLLTQHQHWLEGVARMALA
jgi:hypothetical protein